MVAEVSSPANKGQRDRNAFMDVSHSRVSGASETWNASRADAPLSGGGPAKWVIARGLGKHGAIDTRDPLDRSPARPPGSPVRPHFHGPLFGETVRGSLLFQSRQMR
jgi:hypothetical protein